MPCGRAAALGCPQPISQQPTCTSCLRANGTFNITSSWSPSTEMHAVPLFQSQSDSLKSKTKYPNVFTRSLSVKRQKLPVKSACYVKLLCPLFFQRKNTTPLNVFCVFARHVNCTCGFAHKIHVCKYLCNAEAETEIKMTKKIKKLTKNN